MSEVVAELERISLDQVAAAQPAARNTGSIHDDHDNHHRLGEFSGGTKASSAASRNPSGKSAAAMKRPSSTVLDATVTMAGQQVETDPKTEQSLLVPSARSAWWKKWRIPGARPRLLVACAAGAAALLVAGIVLYREITRVSVVQDDKALGHPPLSAIAPFNSNQALAHQEAWAKHLGTKVEIENSLGMKLRLIPPGEFVMGSPQAEIDTLLKISTESIWQNWFRSEGPQHRVKLTQAFYLGSYEVTQRQYQEVMGVNPSHFSLGGEGKDIVQGLDTGELPVELVTWFDAIDFCNKLSEMEKRSPYYERDGESVKVLGGTGYRLPTEAEWEFACRAGTTTPWTFGDAERDLTQHAWFGSNANGRTQRVGKLPANPFGLYDLYGNVWEWCSDWHGVYAARAESDPTGSAAGSGRVLRGGAFHYHSSHCRSADRLDLDPMFCHSDIGLRVTRTIDAKSDESLPAATGGSTARPNDTAPVAARVKPPPPAIAPFDAKQAGDFQEAWAKRLDTKVEIENSLGMKLRLIPPGEFMMGSPQEEIDALVETTTDEWWRQQFASEAPQRRVSLAQAFYLASCEVTQQQYQELMGVNPSCVSLTGPYKDAMKGLDTGQHPVETVSWLDAVDFCNKLSEKEQRSPYYARDSETVKVLGGTGYRLPTEAEWEFACRAGTTTLWSFGDNERDLGQHAWFRPNSNGRTQPVGELPPNPFGLYDLYGNVWEWCWDWHGEYAAGAVSDPTGSTAGSARVLRGAAFGDIATNVRSAFRYSNAPPTTSAYIGFRVVKAIEPETPAGNAAKISSSVSRDRPHIQTTISDEKAGKPADVPPPAIAPFDAKQALAHQEARAKHLGAKVEIENSLGMKLRLIPPGGFMMGSPQDEIDVLVETTTEADWQSWYRSEGPQHRVKLTQAFYLGSCEVTQQQYQEAMGVNPSHFSPTGMGKDIMKDVDTSQHPVESISWFDAIDFCNKLSEREQRVPYYVRYGEVVKIQGGTGYRLPSEAEWEFACRAGTTTRWSFGDTERDLGQHAWFGRNSNGRTQRVGEMPANPFGLYDVYGNVWEWCWDWHGEYAADAVSDPTGSAAGSGRVVRGSAYDESASSCCSAFRDGVQPVDRYGHIGFRVCCGY